MMVGPETPAGLSDMFNDSPEDEVELRSVADQAWPYFIPSCILLISGCHLRQ